MKKTTIIAGVAIVILASTIGWTAFAENDSAEVGQKAKSQTEMVEASAPAMSEAQQKAFTVAMDKETEAALGALVSAGTITKEQADQFMPKLMDLEEAELKALETAQTKAHEDALNKLVTNGTITQEQADSMGTVVTETDSNVMKAGPTTAVGKAEAGHSVASVPAPPQGDIVIKSNEVGQASSGSFVMNNESVTGTMPDAPVTNVAGSSTLAAPMPFPALSIAQQEAIYDETAINFEKEVAKLVNDQSLTEEHAAEVLAEREKMLSPACLEAMRQSSEVGNVETLTALVSEGTITQEQAYHISFGYLDESITDAQWDGYYQMQSEKSKLAFEEQVASGAVSKEDAERMVAQDKATLTEEQMTSVSEALQVAQNKVLDDLVKDGTFSTEEADAFRTGAPVQTFSTSSR